MKPIENKTRTRLMKIIKIGGGIVSYFISWLAFAFWAGGTHGNLFDRKWYSIDYILSSIFLVFFCIPTYYFGRRFINYMRSE